jgi:hypothetical protein
MPLPPPSAFRRGTATEPARPVSVPGVDAALLVLYTLLGLLATARLTRLVTADRISRPFRAAIVRRYGPSSAVGYLVHCRWCVSLYIAGPVAAAVLWLAPAYRGNWWAPTLLTGVLLALGFSHGTALLAGLEDDD